MVALTDRPTIKGTTLVELLVVMTLFSLIMTAILAFYIEASKVTRSQDLYSGNYRRLLAAADRIEALTAYSRIYKVSADKIIFSRCPEQLPLRQGLPNWQSQASTIVFTAVPPSLFLYENEQKSPMLPMHQGDLLTFSSQAGAGSVSVLRIMCSSDPNLKAAQEGNVTNRHLRELKFTRSILIENCEMY